MIPIRKNTPPTDFTAWKQQEADKLNNLYGKYESKEISSSDKVWGHLPSSPKKEPEEGIVYYSKSQLFDALLEEQHSLCCYCGQEIKKGDKITVEHLIPKSKDIRRYAFCYENLYASCWGYTKEYTEQITVDGLTIEHIARILSDKMNTVVTINDLFRYNNADHFDYLSTASNVFLQSLPIGTMIRYAVKDEESCCNVARRDDDIYIYPIFEDTIYWVKEEQKIAKTCIHKINYLPDGQLKGIDEEAEATIRILNINVPKRLKEKRIKKWEQANEILGKMKSLPTEKQIPYIQKQVEVLEMEKGEMFFVTVYFLEQALEQLQNQ